MGVHGTDGGLAPLSASRRVQVRSRQVTRIKPQQLDVTQADVTR